MVRSLRVLAAAAFVAVSGLASAAQGLLTTESVRAYENALKDLRTGKVPRATAVLKGLLLDRVRVSVESDSLSERDSETFLAGVQTGVDVWEHALPDSPFVFVGKDAAADIVIRFVPRIDRRGQIQGLVQAERSFYYRGSQTGYRLSGDILIRDNVYGRRMTRDEVSRVAAHELGHLLGLDDRYESDGLMGSFVPGPGEMGPTPAELAAVRKFRSDARVALERVYAQQKTQAARRKPSRRP